MEFIKLEQFKSLDENIQKVLLNWWKPKRYDLYVDSNDLSQVECLDYINNNDEGVIYHSMRDNISEKEDMIPLFTEGQLRQFIQDKSKCKNIEISGDIETGQYYADFYEEIYSGIEVDTIENLGTDKFKAYWTLALIFAKEEN